MRKALILSALLGSAAIPAAAADVHFGLVTGWKAGIGCFVFRIDEQDRPNAGYAYGIPMQDFGRTVMAHGVEEAFSNRLPIAFFIGKLPDIKCMIPNNAGDDQELTVKQAYRVSQAFFSDLLP